MQVLDLTTDLGPGTTPLLIEGLVRGVRVATDVALDAETMRARRVATERMKYPTDAELQAALERLPAGDERSPRYRAQQQLAARELLRRNSLRLPFDLWFDDLNRDYRDRHSSAYSALSAAGYERLLGTGVPFLGGGAGLDVLDPVLYDAMVADELVRSMPEAVLIRTVRYENPFWTMLFGKGRAEATVSTAVQVLEAARDYGPKRVMAKADATVAESTIDNRIAESDLDVEIKQELLRELRLRNDGLALENARLAQTIGAEEERRRLVERATRGGQLDIADAIRALGAGDVRALGQLGRRELEVEEHWEADDPPAD